MIRWSSLFAVYTLPDSMSFIWSRQHNLPRKK